VASTEQVLQRRELIGWKLGLERMRRLCSLLGMPQHRFASIHVVGTNGKTSVARMTAALLGAHGLRAGAYLSPHIDSWRERIVIGREPISERAFAEALERAEQAAEAADRTGADEDGEVTQFELVTAAGFLALASAKAEYGVIEAGLGGRLDATNVIPSKLTVLTSVGLDHVEWLGETVEQIAAEKLAVLRDHTALVRGPVPPEVEPVIEREASRRHARVIPVDPAVIPSSVPSPSGYQAANWALALAATEAALGRLDPGAVSAAVAAGPVSVPGRAELIAGDPPVLLDAAHNPDGARALAQALPELVDGREVVCCLAVLEDKDAAGIIAALAPAVARFVCTEIPAEAMEGSGRPGARSRGSEELARLCRAAGAEAEAVADPGGAWRLAKGLAREGGAVALAAGSHYLLKSVWTERRAESSLR
jgi:dihydrofolate synthase/folylpolyglutamate synthase